jgi:hypothetical protein
MTEALKDLLELPPAYQWITAHLMRVLAFHREAPAEEFWKLLANAEWRGKLFLRSDPAALFLLLDAMSEIEVVKGDPWRSHGPHFWALACEAASNDAERQMFLFVVTLCCSIQTDSVSAIERLLLGQFGKTHRDDIEGWRTQLEALQDAAPDWIAARLGAILAAFRAT